MLFVIVQAWRLGYSSVNSKGNNDCAIPRALRDSVCICCFYLARHYWDVRC